MNQIEKKLKLSSLILFLIAFILGCIATLIVKNTLQSEMIQFSTLGLIGFVLSIIFGGASIVLAINAIQLGRSSEDAIIKRNDESIRTQNEVFQKTIEVLSRIESSTGVTEKRIEDIIAGRVGQIADKLSFGNLTDRDKIERELRKSLSKELTPEEREMQEKKKKERDEARKRYDIHHEKTLLTLSNANEFSVLKLGDHGSYGGDGATLFDGLFLVDDNKIGISVFSSEPLLADIFVRGFDQFVTKCAQAISNGIINYFFYVSTEESEVSKKLQAQLKESSNLFKDDLKNSIYILTGNDEELIEKIKKTVANIV